MALVGLGGCARGSDRLTCQCNHASPSMGFLYLLPFTLGRALVDPHTDEQGWIPVLLIGAIHE